GRVKVNGKVIHLGDKADTSKDTISVDGKLLRVSAERIYIALNKPKGYLSDIDENHPRPTVNDLIGISEPLFAVGRLDLDSEGLILMTNDGELANRLTHPRYHHEKEYEVMVIKTPDQEQLEIWRRGVVLEGPRRHVGARPLRLDSRTHRLPLDDRERSLQAPGDCAAQHNGHYSGAHVRRVEDHGEWTERTAESCRRQRRLVRGRVRHLQIRVALLACISHHALPPRSGSSQEKSACMLARGGLQLGVFGFAVGTSP
ncbi:MAG TPA: pseudouridine synthase, partial [Candidatus Paceibacterota bacterium]|nr:pseudouridine synthase [Candidatus Paceibacterota bacterium]